MLGKSGGCLVLLLIVVVIATARTASLYQNDQQHLAEIEAAPPQWIISNPSDPVPGCSISEGIGGAFDAESASQVDKDRFDPASSDSEITYIADYTISQRLGFENLADFYSSITDDTVGFTDNLRLINASLPDGTKRLVWQRIWGANYMVYVDAETHEPLVLFENLQLVQRGDCNTLAIMIFYPRIAGLFLTWFRSMAIPWVAVVILSNVIYGGQRLYRRIKLREKSPEEQKDFWN